MIWTKTQPKRCGCGVVGEGGGGGGGREPSPVFYETIFAGKSNPFRIAKVETLHSISLGLLNSSSSSSHLHFIS